MIGASIGGLEALIKVAETRNGELSMKVGDEDGFARMFFGNDSATGTRRMIAVIVIACVVFGTLAWWLNR